MAEESWAGPPICQSHFPQPPTLNCTYGCTMGRLHIRCNNCQHGVLPCHRLLKWYQLWWQYICEGYGLGVTPWHLCNWTPFFLCVWLRKMDGFISAIFERHCCFKVKHTLHFVKLCRPLCNNHSCQQYLKSGQCQRQSQKLQYLAKSLIIYGVKSTTLSKTLQYDGCFFAL